MMLHSIHRRLLLAGTVMLFGLAFAMAPGNAADDGCKTGEYDSEHDHERARRALECGEVMPLADVLAAVRPHISGKIIETEFEREDGIWVYEMKYIDRQGHLVEIYVDARTGRILKTEGDE
jgi:uncharacterized membrane protein YkoI